MYSGFIKFGVIIWAVLCVAPVVSSGIIHVPSQYLTIQEAIDSALNADTVLVAAGSYTETIDFGGKEIVLLSSDGPEVTILGASTISLTSGEGPQTKIRGFTFSSSPNTQITVEGGAIVEISENIFHSYSGSLTVIRINATGTAFVYRNLFTNNGGISCIGNWGGRGIIINNTFDFNARGFFRIDGLGVARNNIVSNSAQYGIFGVFDTLDYNDVWNNNPDYDGGGSAGPHDISADPLFIKQDFFDYRLEPNSPCVNTGDPSPIYDDPDGTRNDMGAYPIVQFFPIAVNSGFVGEVLPFVVDNSPVFVWQFLDTIGSQSAYEIQVGDDDDWTVTELWETGEVYTSDTTVPYGGLALIDGSEYYFRIRVNNGTVWGDWVERYFRMNTAPTAPIPISPINGDSSHFAFATLQIENAIDPETSILFYDFEVFSDAVLTSLVDSKLSVLGQPDSTVSPIINGISIGAQYWWKSRAFDGFEYSSWSPAETFYGRGPTAVHVPSDWQTIQAAIVATFDGDTILVAPGVYIENLDLLGKGILLKSTSGRAVTLIEAADHNLPIVSFKSGEDSTSVLDDFTIRNVSNNRGIFCTGSSPIIQNCEVSDCVSGSLTGTGIYAEFGSVHIDGCVVRRNSGNQGSGIYISNSNGAKISRNVVNDNVETGIALGAIVLSACSNSRVTNNTVVSNSAGVRFLSSSACDLRNNIIANNSGRGVSLSRGSSNDYNDVWSNSPDGAGGGTNGISADPIFNPDYTLTSNSPCINVGDPDPLYNDPDGTRNDLGALAFAHEIPLARFLNLGVTDTLHVTSHTPTFYWTYLDTLGPQMSHEIEVGIDTDWTFAENWASGSIFSSDTFAVYAGSPLQDGETYFVRVRVSNGTEYGGWSQTSFRMNSLPTSPIPLSPLAGAERHYANVNLVVANSTDLEFDQLTYDFEIYDDASLSNLIDSVQSVIEGVDSTESGMILGLQIGTSSWWRSRSNDGYEFSQWSTTEMFVTVAPSVIRVPTDIPTIQSAVIAAFDDDTVLVEPGTYTGDGNRDINFLGKAIVVMSEFGPDSTIIDCQGTSSDPHLGFYFRNGEDTSSKLIGFTIKNGYGLNDGINGEPGGGGVYCLYSSPIISDCVFFNNQAVIGGAFYGFLSESRIERCKFEQNSLVPIQSAFPGTGAAINISGSDSTKIVDCEFLSNYGGGGGGSAVSFVSASGTLSNCNFSENEGNLGALFLAYSSARANNCTFIRNSSSYGGAIALLQGALEMHSCIVRRNSATRKGGGFWLNGGNAKLFNCTVDSNSVTPSAEGEGGAFYCASSVVELNYCDIRANSARLGGAVFGQSNPQIQIDGSILESNSATVSGGVVFSDGGNVSLGQSTFSGNSSGLFGGAVHVYGTVFSSDYCFFVNNSSERGGGIYALSATLNITNATFSENSGSIAGGGLYLENLSSTSMSKSIVAFSPTGEGIHCADQYSIPVLTCCDIFGNAGGDWVGFISDQETQNDNFSERPHFCSLTNSDFNLNSCSPCSPEHSLCGEFVGAGPVACEFAWGDVDRDGQVTLADITLLIGFYLSCSNGPDPIEAGDANCTGDIQIDDILTLADFLANPGMSLCCQ